jgi:CPA1 family monovalent cation:H+ antiporter
MDVLAIMLSVVSLMFIAIGVFFLSRKVGIPYTILLVVVGLVLIPVSKLAPFYFFQSFTLTPGLLFFVFLPTLIFESAYNMNIRSILESVRSISLLSIVSLLISAFFIAFVLEFTSQLIGFPVPFEVSLLFGSLISATDPVAVLALFKEYGAPKRLSLIFEGESLFNDGTSLALFLVVLELFTMEGGESITHSLFSDIMTGSFMFATMVLGGVIFGGMMGVLFSKIIQRVHNNEFIEITLTMIVAHSTFILSEVISHSLTVGGHPVHLSSIIATVVAAMMVGNYGRYKISPPVLEYMEHFWGYFAFVSNSIIFILIGLLFASLPISLMEIIPITLLTIGIVMIGRAVSVYPVLELLNRTKKEAHVPRTWQHLMAWGSLRGALAVTMVLLIPDTFTAPGWSYDFSVKEFITALTISCIYFTLFIKGMTIGPIIRYFKLNALNSVEEGEYQEAKALLYAKLLLEIERFRRKGYVSETTYTEIKKKYEALYNDVTKHGKRIFSSENITERVLVIFALAMAKHSLKTLFTFNEVSESVYKKILVDLSEQLERAERSKDVADVSLRGFHRDWLDGLYDLWEEVYKKDPASDVRALHMYHRAHAIIVQKAIEELEALLVSDLKIFDNKEPFRRIIGKLNQLEIEAKGKVEEVTRAHAAVVAPLALAFAEAGLQKAQENIVKMFKEREIVTPKVYSLLMEEFETVRRV